MAKKQRPITQAPKDRSFHLEFKNAAQKMAWATFQQHDILFLLGPAGVGKSYLAVAFAINEILAKRKKRIILTRPIVEAGESLGFLPGTFDEKVAPYIMPLFDCLSKLVGPTGSGQREIINQAIEIAPLAYMRGRAQPLDAKIITPNGITTMGDIKVGDEVIGSDGNPTKVLGVYPQGFKDTYSVIFSDGTKVECCGDHLWSTQTLSEKRHNKGFTVKDTKEIQSTLKTKHNQKNHRIPLISGPVQFESKSTKIHPYVLGLLLGDGCFHESAGVKFSTKDAVLAEYMNELLPKGLHAKHSKGYDYSIVKSNGEKNGVNLLKESIRELGLMGKKSYDKFIPACYLYNTPQVRLSVLQGLMDTDGTVGKHRSGNSRAQFSTTSEKLADDVVFLVQSLGGIATKRERIYSEDDFHEYKGHTIRHARNSFNIEITVPKGVNPFNLPRKSEKFESGGSSPRLISAIEYKGRRICQCIRVESDDHLYLTEGCVLTHNTFDDAVCIFDEAQNATMGQVKLFLTRLGENSKMIITGDPFQSDLPGPVALSEVMDRLASVEGIGTVSFKNDSIVRNPLIAKILEKL